MARLLLLIAFLAYPFGAATDTGAASFAAARDIAPLVKARFTLYVPVSHCGFADNQYAFNLALGKFRGSDRETLRKAAYDGWAAGDVAASDQGASDQAADAGPCTAAIDRLKAADDRLLARAEVLPNP